MNDRSRPEFRINIYRTSIKPAWYAYQVYRDYPHELLAGGECRSKTTAKKEAEARIRQLQSGVAA